MLHRVLVAFLSSSFAATAAAAEVRLRSSVACTSSIVRLADVAEIADGDPRTAAALADIPLCPAPVVGGQRLLSQHDVRQLLVLSGVETRTARVTGSETVTVLSEAGSSASTARRPLIASGVRQAVFEIGAEPARSQVRSGAKPPTMSTSEKETEAPPIVDRGTTVTVLARTAGVTITTSGKATEAGASGDSIYVELADTKQRVLARVTGPQSVEITASGGAAPAPAATNPANR